LARVPLGALGALYAWAAVALATGLHAAAQPSASGVTFSRDIAAVLFERCAGCHRPDGSAPFSLLTYQDARSRAAQLAVVTAARTMPPWQPEPGHGAFVGSRRLSDREIDLFRVWASQGAPEGDPRNLPSPPQWTSEWELGPPDLVITLPVYQLRADGPDMFRNIVVPAGFRGTKYVRAWQFRPGNRVVHHATIQMDTTGLSRRLDAADDSPGYEGVVALTARAPDGFFLDWAPGHRPATAVEGTAWPLEGGSDLVVMLHLKPSGKPETVQASLGLYFSDTPPSRLPVMLRLTRQDLDIGPGDRTYETSDSYTLPVDVVMHTVQPHAHYLGRRFEGGAQLPDGRTVPLIRILDWNFNWQDVYHYQDPVALPAGTRVSMRIVYDNSDGNPRNPHRPPRRVGYGQQTDDEMAELWFQVLTRSDADRVKLVKDLRARVLQEEIKGRRAMLTRDPKNVALRDDLMVMLTEAGRFAEAAEEAGRSAALQPASAAAHYNLGAALMAVGRMEQSKAAFEKAIAIDPDHVAALYNLAQVTDIADRAVAIRHLRHVLELRPGWAAAQSSLAWYLARGDADERIEALAVARAVVNSTGSRDVSALDVLATAQAALSQFSEAAATVKQALALLPPGADDTQARGLRSRLEEYQRAVPR
jgi:Flp pilus assembly protein TadD/mono/diheme cytochrome c family protein